MAYTGFWLNGSHGTLAGSSLYKTKGGTQIRSINHTPTNPKTDAQMLHRSLFLDAVKFFHDAQQNLFHFAFQYKKNEWSEFNAFMNANHDNGVNISKAQFQCTTYPALGDWLMSEGGLSQVNIEVRRDSTAEPVTSYYWYLDDLEGGATIGQLSKRLITLGLAEAGDYYTFVEIITQSEYEYGADLAPVSGSPIKWNITQFQVNTSDVRQASSVIGFKNIGSAPGYFMWNPEDDLKTPYACCIIHSRVKNGSTLASTQRLVGDYYWELARKACSTESYVSAVLASWESSGTAILQGAVAESVLNFTGFRGCGDSPETATQASLTGVGAELDSTASSSGLNWVKVEGSDVSSMVSSSLTSSSAHISYLAVDTTTFPPYTYICFKASSDAGSFRIKYADIVLFTSQVPAE